MGSRPVSDGVSYDFHEQKLTAHSLLYDNVCKRIPGRLSTYLFFLFLFNFRMIGFTFNWDFPYSLCLEFSLVPRVYRLPYCRRQKQRILEVFPRHSTSP